VVLAGWMSVSAVGVMAGGCGRPAGRLLVPPEPAVVWPAAPEVARIRWVGALASSADLHAARSGAEAFKAALRGKRPPIRFEGPHGVAVRGGRWLAVADSGGGAVHVLDLQQRTHRVIRGWVDQHAGQAKHAARFLTGAALSAAPIQRLGSPVGVAWAGGRLLVTDAERGEVIEFDADGTYRRRFGGEELVRPVGLAWEADRGRLYVVDGGSHCVRVFDSSGSLVETIGRRGPGAGEFNFPSHICVRDGRMAVADSGNFRVQLLDAEGRCLGIIGQQGDGAGDLSLPKGVAFDSAGHIYVVDARFENVQIFETSGRLLLAFGEEGGGVGRFSLPAGLAIDQEDRIWVADSGNRRVCVLDYLSRRTQNVETSKSRNVETSKRRNVQTSKRRNVQTPRSHEVRES
jgi:DNA-binding beta-propeller fold protein YncE